MLLDNPSMAGRLTSTVACAARSMVVRFSCQSWYSVQRRYSTTDETYLYSPTAALRMQHTRSLDTRSNVFLGINMGGREAPKRLKHSFGRILRTPFVFVPYTNKISRLFVKYFHCNSRQRNTTTIISNILFMVLGRSLAAPSSCLYL